jgi:RimJ/RimL family protein N-acetyltransferase
VVGGMMIKRYKGEKVSLAPVSEECALLWTGWLNDPETAIPLGDEAYMPITLENQQESLKHFSKNHTFSIVDNATDKIIGRCLVFNIDHVNNQGTIGIFIGEKDFRDKGYGEDSLKLLLDYCFCILNLHTIMLGVFDFNKRAIRCYRKVGFKEIGLKREARKMHNKRYNLLLMDILVHEYTPFYLDRVINTIINNTNDRGSC